MILKECQYTYEGRGKWYCVEGKCQQDIHDSYTGKSYKNKKECETDANSSCNIAIQQKPKAQVKWQQPEVQVQQSDNGYKIIEEEAIIVRGPPPKEYLPEGYPLEDIRENEKMSENYINKPIQKNQQNQQIRRPQNRTIPSIKR